MEKDTCFYLINDRIIGKKENGSYYIYSAGNWVPDDDWMILDRLMGYDPSEPSDSPYGIGNTDIMDEIETITYEEAMEHIENEKTFYHPQPIDTSDVVLPEELLALTERIAENVHDVWAVGRIAEGWTYGKKKDTENKKTPLLVPYGDLPENEKDYDRNTAIATLKLIVKLGYKLEKPKV